MHTVIKQSSGLFFSYNLLCLFYTQASIVNKQETIATSTNPPDIKRVIVSIPVMGYDWLNPVGLECLPAANLTLGWSY